MLAPRGDDFTDEQIAAWFSDEQLGYFNLKGSAQERPEYSALNELTLFRHIRRQKFGVCLALGAARGLDIEPLAPMVGRFLVVEPARDYWRNSIGAKPAEYREPTLRGAIDIPAGSMDLAVAIGVLHHIPNVSDILRELHRALKPGAPLLIREPMVAMGDWTKPRPGLTKNERGIPREWLLSALRDVGFGVERATPCNFAPIPAVFHRLGILPYESGAVTRLDLVTSALTAWNARYHRQSLLRKFAPASLAVVARMPG